MDDNEQPQPEPYCVLCESEGHTIRSCPTRDDEYDEDDEDV